MADFAVVVLETNFDNMDLNAPKLLTLLSLHCRPLLLLLLHSPPPLRLPLPPPPPPPPLRNTPPQTSSLSAGGPQTNVGVQGVKVGIVDIQNVCLFVSHLLHLNDKRQEGEWSKMGFGRYPIKTISGSQELKMHFWE